jgi:YD repeat-containing protein
MLNSSPEVQRTYTYNTIGSLASDQMTTGTTLNAKADYSYDAFGRVSKETFNTRHTNSYTYDNGEAILQSDIGSIFNFILII